MKNLYSNFFSINLWSIMASLFPDFHYIGILFFFSKRYLIILLSKDIQVRAKTRIDFTTSVLNTEETPIPRQL